MRGIIVKGIAGFYYVKVENKVYQCKARGKFKKQGVVPTVGDLVEIQVLDDGDGVVNVILPRRNSFLRPPIANVDCMVVVISAADPEPNFTILDKFLVMAEGNRTDVVICVNKVEIASTEILLKIKEIYKDIYPLAFVSCKEKIGFEKLELLLKNKKSALAGPSGVGKSTILNCLMPAEDIEVGEISRKTRRGKHTTRHVEIFETNFGAMLFDTPGFTSFEILEAEEDQLHFYYPEMANYISNCKYDNCRHIKEPHCGVMAAVEEGLISKSRYKSYLEQMIEIREKKKY
ncbi:MAG: ribosome small subunit-dependent GTPase A [Peptostreptococcaceae bacterium]|nr:ribosome small subunit-dependent GTPase A [Peptostreptococcaceae bacterium]